jgi:hypothetical protein
MTQKTAEMPKPAKKKGGNPNPVRTEEFYENQFKQVAPVYGEKLSRKVWSIKLPVDVSEKLAQMDRSERVDLMRRAITDAVRSKS